MDGDRSPADRSPACFLSLVLPAFNEADGIAQAAQEANAALAEFGFAYEIIVVNDGSSDATASIVRALAQNMPALRLVEHDGNRGYGAALRTGFDAARGERIAFSDADCQFHLADLGALLHLTDEHPIAVGYRMDRQDPRLRKFYSRGYNLLARTLLGTRVRDIDCALKVFRREALASILPDSRGFFVNTEMLTRARQRHLHVAEAGVRHRPRVRGQSKVAFSDIPRTLNALLPFWWSQVLFARPLPRDGAHDEEGSRAIGFGLLLTLAVMAGLLFFSRLGVPLLEPEEARYAEIPRQMLVEGRFITPVLHGEAYYQKPPLLYWLVMGCYAVFGVHDWAARIVPATAGVLTILLVYSWGARAVGRWAGFAGAAMLCLSARFLYQAGMVTFDGPLALCLLASMACAERALAGDALRRGWWLAAGVMCGLGMLMKGPVALTLVVPPLVAWQFLDRRQARVGWRGWLLFLGATLLVVAPWFCAVALRDPAALGEFFWVHNLVRFVAPLDHEEPWWHYLPALVVGMLPWSLLLVPFSVYLTKRSASAGRRRPAALGLFLLGAGWCVFFFSLSGCKRPGYILPAYPLVALSLGVFVTHGALGGRWLTWMAPNRIHPAWPTWAHRITLGALAMGMAITGAAAARGLWAWPAALAAGLLLASIFTVFWQRGPSPTAWRSSAACGLTVFALVFLGMHQLLPEYHEVFALRSQVHPHRDLARVGGPPVASYPKRWDSIGFYLERNDVEAYSPQQRAEMIRDLRDQGGTLLFVKQGEALADLLQALPRDLEFVPHEVGPRAQGAKIVSGIVQSRK